MKQKLTSHCPNFAWFLLIALVDLRLASATPQQNKIFNDEFTTDPSEFFEEEFTSSPSSFRYAEYNYDTESYTSTAESEINEETLDSLPFLETDGSTRFLFDDDGYTEIQLAHNFTFLGTTYRSVFINGNGIITFGTGSSAFSYYCKRPVKLPTLAVFLADTHNNRGDGLTTAKLLYRQDTSRSSSLEQVSRDIVKAYSYVNETGNWTGLSWLLLVTWENIPSREDDYDHLQNTFQAILTTDGNRSFVLFYYKNITWPIPVVMKPAEVGIYGGIYDAPNYFLMPGSCTPALINISSKSNFGIPGKFAFRVEKYIAFPASPASVRTGNLLPFRESEGSTRFLFGDDYYQSIDLERPFIFLGTSYSTAYVNGNGIITFGSGSGARRFQCMIHEATHPTISVFLADSDNRRGDGLETAKLLYRQDTSSPLLTRVSGDILKAFPTLNDSLTLNWALIVTWYNIPPTDGDFNNLRNTFQAVLTTDGNNSFVLFYYEQITWPVAELSFFAEAGIFGGHKDIKNSFVIPGSCTSTLGNITSLSNIDIPGKFAFKVDQEVELPTLFANGSKRFESGVELLPFLESSGSHRFYFHDDDYISIDLEQSFNFLGTSYSTAHINGNGIITFGEGRRDYSYKCNQTAAPVPTISVFMGDGHSAVGDGALTAKLFYRQDTSKLSLEKVSKDVVSAFPSLNETLTLKWMLIVTWYSIPPAIEGQHRLRNTFQAILASGGGRSFVIFYYKKITWPVIEANAEAGIYGGPDNIKNSYLIPGSCSPALLDIIRMSNIDSAGKFVFRVDGALRLPGHWETLDDKTTQSSEHSL